MTLRFNPPPNWPPAPPGWVPDPNWQPDPSWPPAPPGWRLWVEDTTPWPAKSRHRLWLALGAITAVVVVVAGSLWYSRGGEHRTSGAAISTKPDITTLTRDLLLGRSQFSGFDGDTWESGVDNDYQPGGPSDPDGDTTISPQQCAGLRVGQPKEGSSYTQIAGAILSAADGSGKHTTMATLQIVTNEVDLKDLVNSCGQYTSSFGGGESAPTATTVRALTPKGLPKWAVAYSNVTRPLTRPDDFKFGESKVVSIEGYYRGVLVNTSHLAMSHNDIDTAAIADKLVVLFTAQVQKLEAAP
ncbi:hypothetical protein KIH27_13560 [Mycobacterium sp. M1]|uniref:DUF5642 domain-containing protein n=1 Tax=Mycolicibacter acidiphilus TaxID=2835306 RepID=A0ABS5RJZ7_9MYCO|nr:hypothetical protein [Mycolicibacter acidiphilus]MBS9534615.1 hypothetical protein [Mycolicibacter acidiphilus]